MFWVSFFWIAAISVFVCINWGLYNALWPNAPLWVCILATGTIDIIYLVSAFDALMSYTYDKLYPGMDRDEEGR